MSAPAKHASGAAHRSILAWRERVFGANYRRPPPSHRTTPPCAWGGYDRWGFEHAFYGHTEEQAQRKARAPRSRWAR